MRDLIYQETFGFLIRKDNREIVLFYFYNKNKNCLKLKVNIFFIVLCSLT